MALAVLERTYNPRINKQLANDKISSADVANRVMKKRKAA